MSQYALYRAFDSNGNLLYVGQSQTIATRLTAHRAASSWYQNAARIEIEWHESREVLLAAEMTAIRLEHPIHNVKGSKRPFVEVSRSSHHLGWAIIAIVKNSKKYGFDGWYRERSDATDQAAFYRTLPDIITSAKVVHRSERLPNPQSQMIRIGDLLRYSSEQHGKCAPISHRLCEEQLRLILEEA